MKLGIVGKPSSGKSTFLNAACLTNAEMADYPFTTITPNLGTSYIRVKCPCKEFGVEHCDGERFVPVPMVDVAGLVPDAHLGKGKGNQFLSDAMDGDALVHVVDASGRTDAQGNPAEGYDAAQDVEWLEDEIGFWIEGLLEKSWGVIQRKAEMKQGRLCDLVFDKVSGLNVPCEKVEAAVNQSDGSPHGVAREILKACKPIIVAGNKADVQGAKKIGVACCAEAELLLRRAAEKGLVNYLPGDSSFEVVGEVSAEQRKALDFVADYVKKFGNTGVQQVIDKAVFEVLEYIVVYPVEDEGKLCDKKNRVLPDAFLMPKGSTALDLAFRVHTDVGEKFKGAVDARSGKKIGKDTELKNGDVVRVLI